MKTVIEAVLEIDRDVLNQRIDDLCWEMKQTGPEHGPRLYGKLSELLQRRSLVEAGLSGDVDPRKAFLEEKEFVLDEMLSRYEKKAAGNVARH